MGADAVQVSLEQVAAFRLARHSLMQRGPPGSLATVSGDMGGAQAQVLSAAEISLWARVRDLELADLESAIWNERTLTKAWCMRRTMFLVPSKDLALFVRGSAMRAEREIRWMLNKGVPAKELERVLDAVLRSLEAPITQAELAPAVSRALGRKVRYRLGGAGWGSRRRVPCVQVGALTVPSNYLLHLAGARGVYCSGPNVGNESTFVRADAWLPHWKDMAQQRAEEGLLVKYLRAYGPATIADFAVWTGMTMTDAERVWSLAEPKIARVDVEGWSATLLREDLPQLMDAELDSPVVRLLPFFDSFLLGHKSHRGIVGAAEHRQVYRQAGWVSPVVLVDGRAAGIWSHARKKNTLEVAVRPFAELPHRATSMVRQEAEDLGRFLGSAEVKVTVR